jgi:hypothetical protein
MKSVAGAFALMLLLSSCSQDPTTHVGALESEEWSNRSCLSLGEFLTDMDELQADGGGGFASVTATSDDQARTVLRRARRWAPRVVESADQFVVNVIDTGPPASEQKAYDAFVAEARALQTSLRNSLVTLQTLDLASVTPEELQRLNDTLVGINKALDDFATALVSPPECVDLDARLDALNA